MECSCCDRFDSDLDDADEGWVTYCPRCAVEVTRQRDALLAALKAMVLHYRDPKITGVIHPIGSVEDEKRWSYASAEAAIALAEGTPGQAVRS